MEQTLSGQSVPNFVNLDADSIMPERQQYQYEMFRAVLIWVVVVCGALFGAYLVPASQQQSWPALVVSISFLTIGSYSAVTLYRMQDHHFMNWVRGWLVIANIVVFNFGFFQSHDFLAIAAMGGIIVMTLAIFLETTGNTYRWVVISLISYILVLVLRAFIHIPDFHFGDLESLVQIGTPFAIIIIMALLGVVTTQHFKHSLFQSESRRKQLELQEKQLIVAKNEAEEARVKAERSDQVKSAFLASMSHELRTPLNAVINFTRFVIDGDTGPINQEQDELLTEVVGSAKHLLNLINDVLDMSKIEADSLNLFIEDDININSIVTSVVTTGRSLLMDKPTRLDSDVQENIPLIVADRQRIVQILLNIMSNACKFTEDGVISVKARHQNDEVIISVKDTGPGIAAEDQALVFEAFKQTKTGLRQGGGTGLGMPIAKSLAEAHGGRLWLESEPGKGATFHLALPIKSAALAQMAI